MNQPLHVAVNTASGSFLLDRDAAKTAIGFAAPMLDALARNLSVNQSGVLYVVVMDPALTPLDSAFEEAILYEQGFGKSAADWDFDYAGAARAKAKLAWRTGCDTHYLQTMAPHRLRQGDSALWGSAIVDGIVVAISGCEAAYDEAAAGSVALLLRAYAKAASVALGGMVTVQRRG
jgi:hypothetical protein